MRGCSRHLHRGERGERERGERGGRERERERGERERGEREGGERERERGEREGRGVVSKNISEVCVGSIWLRCSVECELDMCAMVTG